mgnify:CR=1 FL=1
MVVSNFLFFLTCFFSLSSSYRSPFGSNYYTNPNIMLYYLLCFSRRRLADRLSREKPITLRPASHFAAGRRPPPAATPRLPGVRPPPPRRPRRSPPRDAGVCCSRRIPPLRSLVTREHPIRSAHPPPPFLSLSALFFYLEFALALSFFCARSGGFFFNLYGFCVKP